MSRNYKIKEQKLSHFVSFAVVNWIDVFIRKIYFDIVIKNLIYCQENKGLVIYGCCIMSSHVHLIIGTVKEKQEDILRDFKKHTAKELIKAIKNNQQESRKEWLIWMFKKAAEKNSNNTIHQFWRQNNQPIEMSHSNLLRQKLNYIHNNPLVSGLVRKAEYYSYSSAIDYSGGKGLIDIRMEEL